jgi:hypothetical protein
MGFVVDKVSLGQVLSPANFHATNCSTITINYHQALVQYASTARDTKWAQSHPTKKLFMIFQK